MFTFFFYFLFDSYDNGGWRFKCALYKFMEILAFLNSFFFFFFLDAIKLQPYSLNLESLIFP